MFTLEIIKAIVLGIVEGLTEWLPVSSTGHMILVDEFMSLNVRKSIYGYVLSSYSVRRNFSCSCFKF